MSVFAALSISDSSKFQWTPCDHNTAFGNYRVRSVSSIGSHKFSFVIPTNGSEIQAIWLYGIPGATDAAADIDLASSYASGGEGYTTHTETDTASTYGFAANSIERIDLTSVLSAAAPGDVCGVTVTHQTLGYTVYYLGVMIEYR